MPADQPRRGRQCDGDGARPGGELGVRAGTAARTFLEGGHLFRLDLTGDRRTIADDPRLADRVADNINKWEITESESLLFGRNFGIGTDVQTGPNGSLYIVSLSNGAIYEIRRR